MNTILHDNDIDVIDNIKIEKVPLSDRIISSGVETKASGSVGEIEISTTKENGFFMSLNGIYTKTIEKKIS